MEKDNKTDSKKNPKADADHPDVGLENKTKNKGSFTHGGFKKASEVRHHPGLQVNNSIGSSPDSDNGSENHPFENSSENSDERRLIDNTMSALRKLVEELNYINKNKDVLSSVIIDNPFHNKNQIYEKKFNN